MNLHRTVIPLLVPLVLVAAACGDIDDGDETAAPPTTAAAAATTAAPETTETPETTVPVTTSPDTTSPDTAAAASAVAELDAEQQAVVEVFSAVFDSDVAFDEKATNLENAEALRTAVDAYTAAGSTMGGITLEATDVVITGDEALVTYDVLFGGTPAYQGLDKTLVRVGEDWVVPQAAFCELLTSARVPCP